MVSFPFDSKITGYDENNYPIYDRAVDSTLLSNVINEFVSTGVFVKDSGGFTVSPGEGMTVVVSPGSAIIRGTTCIENNARTLTIQAADLNYDRIDSVVLRYNNNEDVRSIDLYVLQGVAASSPVQPDLTREGAIYEIAIANIYIPVNTVSISNERITDTRADTSRCGWATGVSQDFMESLNNRFAIVNENISKVIKTFTTTYKYTGSASSTPFRSNSIDKGSLDIANGNTDITNGLLGEEILSIDPDRVLNIIVSDIDTDDGAIYNNMFTLRKFGTHTYLYYVLFGSKPDSDYAWSIMGFKITIHYI